MPFLMKTKYEKWNQNTEHIAAREGIIIEWPLNGLFNNVVTVIREMSDDDDDDV